MKRLFSLVLIFLIMLNSITVFSANSTSITDIDNWNHPVKSVFLSYGINVTKVELLNNRTYPIFYCNFPTFSGLQEKEIFKKMLKDTLIANGYWSYKLVSNLFEVEIEGNPRDKKFIKITYKNIDNYFKEFAKADNIKINYEQAKKLMIKHFGPEVQKVGLEADNYEVSIVNYIENIAEYNNKFYYTIHTLESHYDHSTTLGWALIDAYDGSIYYNRLDNVGIPVDESKKPIKLVLSDDRSIYKLLESSLSSEKEPYLWQYNKKNKELQKINLIRVIKLSETLIKGQLLDLIELDDQDVNISTNTLVVATKEKDKYNIYKSITEDDKFRWYLDINSLKSVFKELRDVLYYDNEYGIYALSINGGKIKIEFSNNSKDGWIDLLEK